jgi:hypothetical protein
MGAPVVDVSEELAALDGIWKETVPKKGSSIADGDYVAKITKMEIGKSKNGRLQAVSVFTVADGNYMGKELYRFDGLDKEDSIGYFKAMCETIGLEYPVSMVELPNAIKAFIDSFDGMVNITMKTSKDGQYQNLYVKGLVNY